MHSGITVRTTAITAHSAHQTCKYEIGDSAKDISLPISRDLNHLEALAEKVFDYCLMTKSAFIRLVLSSVCLDVAMEGGYLGTQYSFGTQFAYIDVYKHTLWSTGVCAEKHFEKQKNVKSMLIIIRYWLWLKLKSVITNFKFHLYLNLNILWPPVPLDVEL